MNSCAPETRGSHLPGRRVGQMAPPRPAAMRDLQSRVFATCRCARLLYVYVGAQPLMLHLLLRALCLEVPYPTCRSVAFCLFAACGTQLLWASARQARVWLGVP